MDDTRFDRLTRALVAGSAPRRGALRVLGGLGAALLAARPGLASARVGDEGNTGSCRATGDVCNADADCCSNRCTGGRCLCKGRGGRCEVDRACCSGRCRKQRGRCA